MKNKIFVVFALLFLLPVGCKNPDRYVEIIKTSPYFLTSVTNSEVFDKCFTTYSLRSYRDKGDGLISVRLDGKYVYNDNPHSVQIYYQFTDSEHWIVTDYIIDNESESEIMFIYYMALLFND